MRGQEAEQSKAETIRQVLKRLGPQTSTQEIVRHLKTQKIRVSPQQVSNQKARLAGLGDADLRASVLKKVKALADELGSIAVLRRAINDLEDLMGKRRQ
jgi:hypothetical protein